MSRIAYVNGRYVPHARRRGAYRGSRLPVRRRRLRGLRGRDGRLVDERRHSSGCERSLGELRIAHADAARRAAASCCARSSRRNRVRDGIVYLQVTRGVARARPCLSAAPARRRAWSSPRSSIDRAPSGERWRREGVAVITLPDNRWARVDIKTVGLLPNVLAKQAAREQGAREAWFVDRDGFVTEGASTNAWIVTARGRAGHPAGRSRHPARHHPHGAARRRCRRRA